MERPYCFRDVGGPRLNTVHNFRRVENQARQKSVGGLTGFRLLMLKKVAELWVDKTGSPEQLLPVSRNVVWFSNILDTLDLRFCKFPTSSRLDPPCSKGATKFVCFAQVPNCIILSEEHLPGIVLF